MALSETKIIMTHKLKLLVAAGGVKTAGQRTILANGGCDFVQDDLYAKPMQPREFEFELACITQVFSTVLESKFNKYRVTANLAHSAIDVDV